MLAQNRHAQLNFLGVVALRALGLEDLGSFLGGHVGDVCGWC